MYRSKFSWPRHLLEVSGQLHAPAALPRYPLDRRLGGPQSRCGRRGEEKILDPPVVQPVDYAIPSPTTRPCSSFKVNDLPPAFTLYLARLIRRWRWRPYVPPKHRATCRYIPVDSITQNHRCENLKSYILLFYYAPSRKRRRLKLCISTCCDAIVVYYRGKGS
jgi:hypothetical protein